jgi:hypothetical protein
METGEKIRAIIELYRKLTGRQIVPKNTPIHRTYQYRYAVKFIKNMEGVSWEIIKRIVYYAIEYAREHKTTSMWTRGLWILTKSNIVEIAHERAKKHEDVQSLDHDKVIDSKKFVDENGGKLLDSPVIGGFPNIVVWYESNRISLTYLAMSESCKHALNKIDQSDRSMLPSKSDLIRRRIRCLMDRNFSKKLKSILGNDYINISQESA